MRFHTSLPVNDIDQSIAFYRILFQSDPVKVKSDYAKFLPEGGGLNISFHTNPEGVKKLSSLHLGFELPDKAALDQVHGRLEDAGLISAERDTSICCYARQDKFWVTDPNGFEWELYYLLEDTELKIEPTTACCAPSEGAQPETSATSCC